jgi:DNA-binding transcriptional LysR family regulator
MATEMSFSKTANVLFISQPAVSMQIKKFESNLGMKLFEKIGKNIYLTENGKILYEYTKRIFSLIDEAETRLYTQTGSIAGNVDVGASNTPGTYILPQILGEFKEMYPLVKTNLYIYNTYEIEHMILENKVDFAINGGDIRYGSQISVEKLVDDEVVHIVSPSNMLANFEYIDRTNLVDARYITHEKNSQLYRLVLNILDQLGLPLNISMTLGNIEAIKQAVSANLGISAIPRSALSNELEYGNLKEVKIKGRSWEYPYNLIYFKNKHLSSASVKLMELVRMRMSNLKEKRTSVG